MDGTIVLCAMNCDDFDSLDFVEACGQCPNGWIDIHDPDACNV